MECCAVWHWELFEPMQTNADRQLFTGVCWTGPLLRRVSGCASSEIHFSTTGDGAVLCDDGKSALSSGTDSYLLESLTV